MGLRFCTARSHRRVRGRCVVGGLQTETSDLSLGATWPRQFRIPSLLALCVARPPSSPFPCQIPENFDKVRADMLTARQAYDAACGVYARTANVLKQ
jgi:hypothetical protein